MGGLAPDGTADHPERKHLKESKGRGGRAACSPGFRPCCKPHSLLGHFSGCVSVWISCIPVAEEDGDCYTGNGLAYRGTRSRTKSGFSCLPWNSVFLTSKIYTAWKSNARALGLGKHNHCRCASGACPRGGRGGAARKSRGWEGPISQVKRGCPHLLHPPEAHLGAHRSTTGR